MQGAVVARVAAAVVGPPRLAFRNLLSTRATFVIDFPAPKLQGRDQVENLWRRNSIAEMRR